MLIKRLEVKGFKSLKDVVWEPGPLTILIGPNGSGKSNLLHSIQFLQFAALGNLSGFITTMGGLNSLFWDGEGNTISLSTSIAIPTQGFIPRYNNANYHIDILGHSILGSYNITNEYLTATNTTKNNSIILIQRGLDSGISLSDENKDIIYNIENKSFNKEESILSKFNGAYNLSKTGAFIHYNIGFISVYKDINTASNANIRRPAMARYEKILAPNGQNLVNVLHTLYSENRDFENDINTAMRAAFGDNFDRLVFPPAADQLVQLRIRWKSLKREQSMLDLSDGTIRFLFLMTVLCNPEPPSLIAIDEPETGLHPSMFPIIAEYAAEASKRTQVIFSTHSPQFLDAFSDCDVTTTVTSWENGETKIKNLDGEALKEWLTHYSLGTLFLSGDLEALA